MGIFEPVVTVRTSADVKFLIFSLLASFSLSLTSKSA